MPWLTPLALDGTADSGTFWYRVRVIDAVPTPLVSVTVPGVTDWPSLLVSVTTPLELVATLPKASLAVTVTLKAAPAVVLLGALTSNEATAAGLMVMEPLTPLT